MSDNSYNILIVGVGGQGVLLASEIISEVSIRHGFDVKKSEVHGMSQRGGVVSSHIRIGQKIYSPTIEMGQAEVLISFEKAEGLRAIEWLKQDGVAIISTTALIPAIVTSNKNYTYPEDAIERVAAKVRNTISVPGDLIAGELGNPRLVNTILLGVLSNYMPFSSDLWREVIKAKVKERFVEVNLEAFKRGRQLTRTKVSV